MCLTICKCSQMSMLTRRLRREESLADYRNWERMLGGKSKTGIAAVAGLVLASALCLPAQGQRPKHDQPASQRQSAPRHESTRPPRQDRSPVRRGGRSAGSWGQRPQSSPASAYSRPGAQYSRGYPQGPSRQVARPPSYARPNSEYSQERMQGHEVPHPPSQTERRPQTPASGYEAAQRRDVPRPPTPGQSRPPQFAQQQARTLSEGQPHPQTPAGFASGQAREVPRPPQASNSLGREVPRPPQANQHHGGDWLRTHRDQPLAEQQKALQSDPQFRNLPPQQQQRLVNRLQHFNSLPAQEQQRRLNRIETWEHLTPQQKQQARQLASQWQQLPPPRRQMMKTAIGDLRAMPPEERERVLESDKFRSMFSEQERTMLRETTKLPLAPAQPTVPRPPQE